MAGCRHAEILQGSEQRLILYEPVEGTFFLEVGPEPEHHFRPVGPSVWLRHFAYPVGRSGAAVSISEEKVLVSGGFYPQRECQFLAAQYACLPRDKGRFQPRIARRIFVKHLLRPVLRAVVHHNDLEFGIVLLKQLMEIVAQVFFFFSVRWQHEKALSAHEHVTEPEPHLVQHNSRCTGEQIEPKAGYVVNQFSHLS